MTTFIGRKMWAVIEDENGMGVLEIKSTMSRTALEKHVKSKHNLVMLMTKSQVEKFQQLSLYEFSKKYGKKGWHFRMYSTINHIDVNSNE